MPRRADVDVQRAIVERAAGMLARRETLTLRALVEGTGRSTMAVYTHFGGMPGLRSAVRQEGFTLLAARLARVPKARDPVRHVAALGAAYLAHALAHPDLYRAMFDAEADLLDAEAADASFAVLVGAVTRAREAGRVRAATNPQVLATQIWAGGHGLAMLTLSGVLPLEAVGALGPDMVQTLVLGAGDHVEPCRRSVRAGWAVGWELPP